MAYKQPSSGLPFKEIGSSPAKQVVSGDASEAVKHYNKWKADKYSKPNMKATSKGFATDWHLENKKAQNVKLAKANKKSTSTLDRVTKTLKKGGKKFLKKAGKLLPGVGTVLTAADLLTSKSATATQPGTGTHGGKRQTKYNPKTGKYE